ncbi:DMT family transporter [bacterium]|nr:DMT family transporter [bacterium]
MLRKFQWKQFEKASFYMVLSSVLAALFGLFSKTGMETVFLPLMVFLRFFIPFLIVLPYYYNKPKSIRFKDTHKHLLRAIAVLISQYSLFYYFTRASLTDGVLLFNTAPMFMPIIIYLFYGHRTGKVVWMSLIVSFIGVICVLKPGSSLFDPFSFFGFLAGFFVAISQILFGINRESDTLSHNVFLFFFYSSILSFAIFLISLVFYPFGEIWKSSFPVNQVWLPILSIFGVGIGSIGNQLLRGIAYKNAKPASLAPFIYLSVLFAAGIDLIIHPETVHGFTFTIGMILIFVGTIIRIGYRPKA